MELKTLLYERRGRVAKITLNRPNVLNAINSQMIGEMHRAMDLVEADDDTRVVVLMGAGRAFSAGYDLKETAASGVSGTKAWRSKLETQLRFTLRIWDSPKPVIAAVHGHCLAGACDLMMMCDLAVAAEGTLFGEPEIRFGSGVVTLIMPWVLGMKKTRELLYTGHDKLAADEALALGLINRVVPMERLEDDTFRLAEEIATIGPQAIKLTKASINRTYEIMGLRQALLANLDIDTLIETAEDSERVEFNRICNEQGLRAALNWREARFRRLTGSNG
jgi:enoyl-CoA hydratase